MHKKCLLKALQHHGSTHDTTLHAAAAAPIDGVNISQTRGDGGGRGEDGWGGGVAQHLQLRTDFSRRHISRGKLLRNPLTRIVARKTNMQLWLVFSKKE